MRVWRKAEAFGVQLQQDAVLRLGDSLAIEGRVDFSVGQVESLQVDDVDQDEVNGPISVGVKASLPRDLIREGMRAFTVARA